MKRNIRFSNLWWLTISLLVIVIDQATKYFVRQKLTWGLPVKVTAFFNLLLLSNTGAAFNLLDSGGGWQLWLFVAIAVVVSIVIIAWLLYLPPNFIWTGIGLSLVLGGALGNLYDRINLGYVVDFLQFHVSQYYWPVFNVADSAICIGAAILVIIFLFSKNKSKPKL